MMRSVPIFPLIRTHLFCHVNVSVVSAEVWPRDRPAKDRSTMLNPLTAEWALRAQDFTLSNARRFYSSMGNPLDAKGLSKRSFSTTHSHTFLILCNAERWTYKIQILVQPAIQMIWWSQEKEIQLFVSCAAYQTNPYVIDYFIVNLRICNPKTKPQVGVICVQHKPQGRKLELDCLSEWCSQREFLEKEKPLNNQGQQQLI